MQVYEQRGIRIHEMILDSSKTHSCPAHRSCLYLPWVFCAKRRELIASDAYPIPEALRLHADDPVLTTIRQLERDRLKAERTARDEVTQLVNQRQSTPETKNAWERLYRGQAVGAETFLRLAEQLRSSLDLPGDRPINPRNRVGELAIECVHLRIPELAFGGLRVFPITAQQIVLDRLGKAGITGYEVYPAHVVKFKGKVPPPPLFEIAVTGRAGLPGPGSTPWFLDDCDACGLQHIINHLDKVVVDPDQYDGSDIFCFSPWPQVFVTDRFIEALQNPRAARTCFRPMFTSRAAW